MTVIFFRFPHIHVKDDDVPVKFNRVKVKKKTGKYNHMQMLLDKINGMSWKDIAIKHDVVAKDPRKLSNVAKYIALNSSASSKLSPDQVKILEVNEK